LTSIFSTTSALSIRSNRWKVFSVMNARKQRELRAVSSGKSGGNGEGAYYTLQSAEAGGEILFVHQNLEDVDLAHEDYCC